MKRQLKQIELMHICVGAALNCYALQWSYGDICVGCGCCSKDADKRLLARLEYHTKLLEEKKDFRFATDAQVRAVQEKNVAAAIKFHQRKVMELKRRCLRKANRQKP